MAITYEIDEDAGIATVTASGSIGQAEDLECFRALLADRAYRPGMGLLLDYRERESVATTEQVKQFVAAGEKLREAFGDPRIAVVVSGDVAFGMARMYSALAEESSVPTSVFRDLEEAMRWLAGEPPG
jgi:hypothetical protein